MAKTTTQYVCAAGMHSGSKRMERGDPYTGSEKSVPWLVEQGHLVEAGSDAAQAIADELSDTEKAEG